MLLFLKVFFTEFIAEMGDKTQLMLIALTSKYIGGRTGQRIYPGMAD